jgi:hypothetical protein
MSPSEVAVRLRQIADKIDASQSPSVAKVAADVRLVLSQILDGGVPARQATGPAGRRMAPSRQPAVDVTDDRAYRDARARVASTKR